MHCIYLLFLSLYLTSIYLCCRHSRVLEAREMMGVVRSVLPYLKKGRNG